MKIGNIKTGAIWIAGAVISLLICFLLCRYAFFAYHGNKDWSVVMLVMGLVAIGIAAVFDGRKMMVCAVAGYIGGFVMGLLLGVEGADQGGGATNNWWVIWTVSFIAIVIAGVVWEIAGRWISKRRNIMLSDREGV